MAGNAQDTWSLDEEDVVRVSFDEARKHDEFWRKQHAYEGYFRAGLDYEDYAPAYCAGYIGHAQYGGNYDDAEKSLLSNWMRIKGDSRLELDEARLAMRAAWDRSAALVLEEVAEAAQRDDRHAATAELAAQSVRDHLERLVLNAAAWKDRVQQRLLGNGAMGPLHQGAQQGGLARRQV